MNIHDENDCAPKFRQPNYQFRLSKSSPIGFFIGQVQAHDKDHSPNFRFIQYKLGKNVYQAMFYIDSNNGSLVLVKHPLTETNINLTVRAIDQQNRSLYDQVNIEILLFDPTKCLPKFNQTLYVFNTTEHEKIPYEIGK